MIRLSNPFLEFSLNPELSTFNLTSTKFPGALIEGASFGPELASPSRLNFSLESVVENPAENLITLHYQDPSGVGYFMEFDLPRQAPFLFQSMRMVNNSNETIQVERFHFANIQQKRLRFSENPAAETAFFSNGWQSWSPAGTWQYRQRQTRSLLFPFSHPMLYDDGTPITWRKSRFSSDMFAALLDHEANVGLVCGFLSQREQFGSLVSTLHPEPDLMVWANCDRVELRPGETLGTDRLAWQFFDLQDPKPFTLYMEKVAEENQVKPRMKTPLGWCSWYYYFQKITPWEIRKNLDSITGMRDILPLEFFQIDDGFEQDVGSWLEFNAKFRDGLSQLSAEIRAAGYIPGVWLAPFIVERHSKLVRKHPEWLLRKKSGKLVNSGFVWENFGYAFDLTRPDVQEYVREVIRTAVDDWGYPYLKLDFLYAAALPGKHHDPTLTRAQILRNGLELIRHEAGEEAILLGCGCPLGSGMGVFDMMRVSADVAPDWEPKAYGVKFAFKNEPNMPSVRNAIRNIITRANLDPHLWVNDPDCLLVREDSDLSLAEVQSLATAIGITGGAILISDDMTRLRPESLRISQSLLPVLPPNPEVKDLFMSSLPGKLGQKLQNVGGQNQLIALFNWQDHPADLIFDAAEWGFGAEPSLMREFWTGEIALFQGEHRFEQVPPHGVRLFAVKPLDRAVYVGSDLHISQGMELTQWQLEPAGLGFSLELDRKADGNCYLWMQENARQVLQNGSPDSFQVLNKHILQIPVRLNATSPIRIRVNYY